MRKLLPLVLMMTIAASVRAALPRGDLVLVEGGLFKNAKSNYHGKTFGPDSFVGRPMTVASFYIGRCEVTQKEWVAVMGSNPSKFHGDNLPVEMVSWYDCIEYCNKRSRMEGLKPYYSIDETKKDPGNKNEIDNIKWTVTIDRGADGYRLPTEAEWEYAADGGQLSKGFTYSGSDDLDKVGWYWANAGDKPLAGYWSWPAVEHNHDRTHPVGQKAPNELGLYDMSGNVREWCWNWYGEAASADTGPASATDGRVWRGGGWIGGDFCCAPTYRAGYEASGRAPDQGLRVCRNQGAKAK